MRFKGSFIDLGVRVCIFDLRWVYGDCVKVVGKFLRKNKKPTN